MKVVEIFTNLQFFNRGKCKDKEEGQMRRLGRSKRRWQKKVNGQGEKIT